MVGVSVTVAVAGKNGVGVIVNVGVGDAVPVTLGVVIWVAVKTIVSVGIWFVSIDNSADEQPLAKNIQPNISTNQLIFTDFPVPCGQHPELAGR